MDREPLYRTRNNAEEVEGLLDVLGVRTAVYKANDHTGFRRTRHLPPVAQLRLPLAHARFGTAS